MSKHNMTLGKKGYTDYMRSLGYTKPDGKQPMTEFESISNDEKKAWDETIKRATAGALLIGLVVGVSVPTVVIVLFLAVKGLLTLF